MDEKIRQKRMTFWRLHIGQPVNIILSDNFEDFIYNYRILENELSDKIDEYHSRKIDEQELDKFLYDNYMERYGLITGLNFDTNSVHRICNTDHLIIAKMLQRAVPERPLDAKCKYLAKEMQHVDYNNIAELIKSRKKFREKHNLKK